MFKLINWFFPETIKEIFLAYKLKKNQYYKKINKLDIDTSGISDDNLPYIKLKNGLIFFGYYPSKRQKYFYKYFLDKNFKSKISENCINVAFDICVRYLGPSLKSDHLSEGKYYDFSPGDSIVEVGAYIGFYAMRAAEIVGEKGCVVAVEAMDQNMNILKKNVEENRFTNIILIQKAAWNKRGNLKFFRRSRQLGSLKKEVVNTDSEFLVECDTIDNILNDINLSNPAFIRIQVNGAENEVLEGISKTIQQKPVLLIAAIYNESWKEIVRQLKEIGYTTTIQKGNVLAKWTN